MPMIRPPDKAAQVKLLCFILMIRHSSLRRQRGCACAVNISCLVYKQATGHFLHIRRSEPDGGSPAEHPGSAQTRVKTSVDKMSPLTFRQQTAGAAVALRSSVQASDSALRNHKSSAR